MRRHWKFSTLGVVIYILLVGWVLFASMTRFLIDVSNGDPVSWQVVTGITIGLLGLTGIGWGHIIDHEEPKR